MKDNISTVTSFGGSFGGGVLRRAARRSYNTGDCSDHMDKPVFCLNGWTDQAGYWHGGRIILEPETCGLDVEEMEAGLCRQRWPRCRLHNFDGGVALTKYATATDCGTIRAPRLFCPADDL